MRGTRRVVAAVGAFGALVALPAAFAADSTGEVTATATAVQAMASAEECVPVGSGGHVITFDEEPRPANFSSIAERYAAQGVHFLDDADRTPVALDNDTTRNGFSTQSPPVSLFNQVTGDAFGTDVPLVITFDEPQSHVGFYMGNNDFGDDPVVRLSAYDASGALLGEVTTTLLHGNVTQFWGIAHSGGAIRKLSLTYGAMAIGEEIDTLCYGLSVPEGVTGATIALSAGQAAVEAGAAEVRKADVPVSAIGGSATTQAAPMDGIPMDGIPMDGIPMDGIPMDGIPMDGIGFTVANLAQNGLGGVPLSTIPLTTPAGGWASLLLGTPLGGLPVDSLTLADVLQLAPTALASVRMSHVDFSNTPLASLPLVVLVLGGTPLDSLPILGNTGEQNRADWCGLIDAQPGFDCPGNAFVAASTLTSIGLQGVPMDGIPMDGIPLEAVAGLAIPMDGIPMDGIDVRGSRLGDVRLTQIDMTVSPLAALALDALPAAVRDAIVDCGSGFACAGQTLGAAAAGNAIRATATLADLHGQFGTITLGGLLVGLPTGLTLHDLFEALLDASGYSWSDLPRTFPLQDFAVEGGEVAYTAQFTLNGSGGPAPATITATLPPGSRYVRGSSRLFAGGSTTALAVPEPVASGAQLTWTLPSVAVGTAHDLSFTVRPGLALLSAPASATVASGSIGPVSSGSVPLTVNETFPGNDDPATAPIISADSLYVSHIPNGDDVDYYRIAVPPLGASVTVHLVRLDADYDVAVFGSELPSLRSAPMDGIPMDGITLSEEQVTLGQRTEGLSPESVADVGASVPGQTLRGISAARGTADEEVRVVSVGEGGYYTIQVSSFGSASSTADYMLYYEIEAPPALGPCSPRAFPHAGAGVAGAAPVVPAGANTLFVTNRKRLGDTFGAAAADDVLAAVNRLAGRGDLGVTGAVLTVEHDAAVAAAYAAWDADPCSPALANDVVRAILARVDAIRAANPGIKYVVPVGGDDIVPMSRLLDQTVFANERGYASTFAGANNQISSSFANSYILSDDPYGDTNTSVLVGAQLHIPELAVGRLVETPADIVAQVVQFEAAGGVLDPQTKLVASYDFLKDMGAEIFSALAALTGTNMSNDTWTRADLLAAMFPASNPPLVDSINMHFDHYRALPADQNAAHTQSELLQTSDISSRGAKATDKRMILTVGCHSGLPLPDVLNVPGPAGFSADWAQTFAAASAAIYLGNTGYGLGDTTAVAYSERLHDLLAERFSGPIGDALVAAKQEFYAELAVVTGYEVKVTTEATLFGLPMYQVGAAAAPPAPPAPLPTGTDPATGLVSADFALTPTFQPVSGANGTYYRAQAGAQATSRRPIQPLVSVDATQPGTTAHDVVVTQLARTSSSLDAAFSRPVFDEASTEPELVGELTFPTRLQAISTSASPNGRTQRAILFAGRFRSDGVPDAQGIGVQELFTSIGGTILYSTSKDFRRPAICGVEVVEVGANVAFTVCASDVTETGAAGQVKRVLVLYREPGDGPFKTMELGFANGVWSGAGPIAGDQVDYFVQVVDAAGNVAVASNKGSVQPIPPTLPTGGIGVALGGTSTGGWFTGPVTVTISPAGGASAEYSVDGAAFAPYSAPFEITGDGVRKIEARGSNGSTSTAYAAIDTTPPTVSTVERTYVIDAAATPEFSCRDAGSGIDSCTAPATLDTTSVGAHTFTVTAIDRVGNRSDVTGTYHVVWPFDGFFSPVARQPTVNIVKAGSAVPVKFSLGGDRGLDIFAAGYPLSQVVACDSSATAEIGDEVTLVGDGLTYTLGVYQFNWKTDKSWTGCRDLVLKLRDGTFHRASFRFR